MYLGEPQFDIEDRSDLEIAWRRRCTKECGLLKLSTQETNPDWVYLKLRKGFNITDIGKSAQILYLMSMLENLDLDEMPFMPHKDSSKSYIIYEYLKLLDGYRRDEQYDPKTGKEKRIKKSSFKKRITGLWIYDLINDQAGELDFAYNEFKNKCEKGFKDEDEEKFNNEDDNFIELPRKYWFKDAYLAAIESIEQVRITPIR